MINGSSEPVALCLVRKKNSSLFIFSCDMRVCKAGSGNPKSEGSQLACLAFAYPSELNNGKPNASIDANLNIYGDTVCYQPY